MSKYEIKLSINASLRSFYENLMEKGQELTLRNTQKIARSLEVSQAQAKQIESVR